MCRQSGRTGVDIVVYSSKRSAGSDSSRANWSIRMSPFELPPATTVRRPMRFQIRTGLAGSSSSTSASALWMRCHFNSFRELNNRATLTSPVSDHQGIDSNIIVQEFWMDSPERGWNGEHPLVLSS